MTAQSKELVFSKVLSCGCYLKRYMLDGDESQQYLHLSPCRQDCRWVGWLKKETKSQGKPFYRTDGDGKAEEEGS